MKVSGKKLQAKGGNKAQGDRLVEEQLKVYGKRQMAAVISEAEIKRTIVRAKEAFYDEEQGYSSSYFQFLFDQLAYMSKRWWLAQLLILAVLWRMLDSAKDSYALWRSMGVLAPLFVIMLIPELWKNRSNDAMEIEGAAYFSLRQVYAARMLLFAMADLLMLSVFFGGALLMDRITIQEIIVHFLLPFNVTCCICFRMLHSRWGNSEYIAVGLSILWSGVWIQIVLNEAVYEIVSMPVWTALAALAAFYLLFVVYQVLRKCGNYWEVKTIWN